MSVQTCSQSAALLELLGATAGTGIVAAMKYRHPEDSALTWSGRGRKPRWVVEFLAKGGKIESLAI
jgi:DNA-binding protein H-NS